MCLTEIIVLLDKICSVISYSAIDHEFSVKESITYFKWDVKQRKSNVMYWSADENVTKGLQELTLLFHRSTGSGIC